MDTDVHRSCLAGKPIQGDQMFHFSWFRIFRIHPALEETHSFSSKTSCAPLCQAPTPRSMPPAGLVKGTEVGFRDGGHPRRPALFRSARDVTSSKDGGRRAPFFLCAFGDRNTRRPPIRWAARPYGCSVTRANLPVAGCWFFAPRTTPHTSHPQKEHLCCLALGAHRNGPVEVQEVQTHGNPP